MTREATLDGEARLGTSESDRLRWRLINALPVALGESRAADTVKGGIARAPACCRSYVQWKQNVAKEVGKW